MINILIYYIFAPTIVTISDLAMYRQLQTTMKKYNIICTKTSLNGKEREEFIHRIKTDKVNNYIPGLGYGHFVETQDTFSEEEVIAEMINLFLENGNVMFVDNDYIQEDIECGDDVSWYKGDGFYTVDSRKKMQFNPLVDYVEIEERGYNYTYEVKEVEE